MRSSSFISRFYFGNVIIACGPSDDAAGSNLFSDLAMDKIVPFPQNVICVVPGVFLIKFNPEDSVFKFPVVNDADVPDADLIHGEQRRNGCDSAGFVVDIHVQKILSRNRSPLDVVDRIPVILG